MLLRTSVTLDTETPIDVGAYAGTFNHEPKAWVDLGLPGGRLELTASRPADLERLITALTQARADLITMEGEQDV